MWTGGIYLAGVGENGLGTEGRFTEMPGPRVSCYGESKKTFAILFEN